MKSARPKVLHRIGGRSLVEHAMAAARGTEPAYLAVVVRHQRDVVAEHVLAYDPEALVCDQDEIKGTGRAVECALFVLPDDLSGTILVTYGDVPLLTTQTLDELLAAHAGAGNTVTVLTAAVEDPTGYGRIVRDEAGEVQAIVEHKDATDAQRAITEINSGIFAFDAALLRAALGQVGTNNVQGEKYLTDVVAIARAGSHRVGALLLADTWQTEGVNDKVQLATLGAELNRRTLADLMRAGAIVVDPATTLVEATVSVGEDTMILPGTQLLGATSIGRDCVIGPEVTIADTEIGDGARVVRSQVQLSEIGAGASVGPYAVLKPASRVAPGEATGSFVVRLADPTQAPEVSA